MELKVSTLGSTQNNETLQNTEEIPAEQAAPVETVAEEKPVDISHTEIKEGEGLDKNAEKVIDPEPVVVTDTAPNEENETTFSFKFDEETPASSTETKPTPAVAASWQDAIKGVDPKEIAKALGITDFALELNDHISKGGNAVDYLSARAIDYTKITDSDLIKDQLRRELPNATSQQLDLLISKKYSQSEAAEDDDREYGNLQMQMDANKIRQERIAKQQSFKIPETPINNNKAEWEQQQQQLAVQEQQRAQQQRDLILSHEATRDLISNKRVSIDLGEGTKPFNIKVDDRTANYMVKLLTDGEAWGKVISNEKGEPNVALLQKLVAHAIDPNYDKNLYLSGKMAGERSRIEQSQNVKKPVGTPVIDMQSQGFKVKGTSTIGAH
jgi:hypothetical protein